MKKPFSILQILPAFLLAFLSFACADQGNSDTYSSTADTAEQMGDSVVEQIESESNHDNDSDSEPEAAVLAPSNQFNLNTASDEDFDQIPGITDHMKYEFDEYRPYSSIADFRKEMGKYIDADQIAAYEKYLFVPVDFNSSDALSLQQIPGVNASIATAIMAGRPYDSAEAFMAKAKSLLPSFDAEKAAKFLAQ